MELCLKAVPLLLCVYVRSKIWRTKQDCRLPHSTQSSHSCTFPQTYGLRHAKVYFSICMGLWEWDTGEHIRTQEKGSTKREDRTAQGRTKSWFMMFTILGWRNQEGWYRWAGYAAHVGQIRNAQIMKRKDRPIRAWKNTGSGVCSEWIRFKIGTVMGYIKGTLSDCQLPQKHCPLQCWSFSYIRIVMLAEEKPLWLIH